MTKTTLRGRSSTLPIRVDKDGEQYPGKEVYGIYSDDGEYGCKAPYKPGDVLWVRETWAEINTNFRQGDMINLYFIAPTNIKRSPSDITWRLSIHHAPRSRPPVPARQDVRVEGAGY